MLNDDPIAYEPEPITARQWIRTRALDAAVRSVSAIGGVGGVIDPQREEILARADVFARFIEGTA